MGVHEPKNLDTRPSLKLNDRPVLITPHDAPAGSSRTSVFW